MSTHLHDNSTDRALQTPGIHSHPPPRCYLWPVLAPLFAATALVLATLHSRRDADIQISGSDQIVTAKSITSSGGGAAKNAGQKSGPPVRLARAPYMQWTTVSSAHVVWDTDAPATSSIAYMQAPQSTAHVRSPRMSTHAGAQRRISSGRRVTRHIVKLSALRASSTYIYRVESNGRTMFQGRFQTAKQPGQAARIAIWGDSGVGDRNQYAIAAQIEKARPDCLVHTGDLIYPRGAERDFNPEFFRVYGRLLSRVPFYGSLGNHDVGTKNGAPFLASFVFPTNGPSSLPPERNYSFDYAGAHFVVIDSNQSEERLKNVIVPWLGRDLSASRATWKFAVFHHPPFSSGEHGDEIRTQRALSPAFSRFKIDIVFNGHDHGYERWKPRAGVVYIVSAAGGANLYKRTRRDPMTALYQNQIHSWTQLDLRGNLLRGRQIGSDGRILDNWTMSKP